MGEEMECRSAPVHGAGKKKKEKEKKE